MFRGNNMTYQGGEMTGVTGVVVTGVVVTGGASAVVRLQVRLTPATSLPGFYARVSGGRLDAPIEFSDKDAFVGFLTRIAETGPGLK